MSKIIILQLFIIFSSVKSEKVSIYPLHINLESSQELDITLQLSAPIQCSDPHSLCDVVVLFTNPNSNKLQITPCMARWDRDHWDETRTITIKMLEEYTSSGETNLEIITEPIISNAEFYSGVNLDNIQISLRSIPSARCSSTGDPHYTTFDGYSYHHYGRGEVLMVRSLSRVFEVQARTHGGGYSRNCAVAAREDNNLVIIDVCSGSLNIETRYGNTQPKPSVYNNGGNHYIIDFPSGSTISSHIWGNNMNIYISVIGGDWGNTMGMCGTYDGNPGNEGNPSYIIWSHSQLPDSWKINEEQSLWRWEPSVIEETIDSDEYSECHYSRPLTRRPILRIPNIEDITELLLESSNSIPDRNYTFVPQQEEIINTLNREDATSICEGKILGSEEAQHCQSNYGMNLQLYLDNCIEDVLQMSNAM